MVGEVSHRTRNITAEREQLGPNQMVLQELTVGKRNPVEHDREEDDAMERLQRRGLDPPAYLPDY